MMYRTIAGKKYYFNQYMYFTPIKSDADKYEKTLNPKNQSNTTETIKPETQEKNIINKENQLNNAKVNNSMIEVATTDFNEKLQKYIENNEITWSDKKYKNYYNKNLQ